MHVCVCVYIYMYIYICIYAIRQNTAGLCSANSLPATSALKSFIDTVP